MFKQVSNKKRIFIGFYFQVPNLKLNLTERLEILGFRPLARIWGKIREVNLSQNLGQKLDKL